MTMAVCTNIDITTNNAIRGDVSKLGKNPYYESPRHEHDSKR